MKTCVIMTFIVLCFAFAKSQDFIDKKLAFFAKKMNEEWDKKLYSQFKRIGEKWSQKMNEQRLEFEARIEFIENKNSKEERAMNSKMTVAQGGMPLAARVATLEAFHDTSFNGFLILVLGGDSSLHGNKATVFNKEHNCQKFPDLPRSMHGSVGAYLNKKPVICSGRSSNGYRNECYKYEMEQWIHFASLETPRSFAAGFGIVLDSGKLWITGGFNGSRLKSTEFVQITGAPVSEGYDLLEPIYGHCMLKTSDKRIFIIGGNNGNYIGTTRIYLETYDNTHFTENGPSLNIPRYKHGCSIISSANHDGRDIAVVIGGHNGYSLNSVEIWDFKIEGSKWKKSS